MPRFLLFIFLLALGGSLHAQAKRYPVLSPFELNDIGSFMAQFPLENGLVSYSSDTLQLAGLPKRYPYRIVAYFDSCRLISLHVLFNETGNGLSYEGFEAIRKALLNLWAPQHYPNGIIRNRRGMGNIAHIWETMDFRVEWTYQKQKNDATKKMGWLFLYTRNQYIEDYH
jgi:hypothetical protein